MHQRRFLAAVKLLRDYALAIAVRVEVYGACGDDAAQVGSEAFEETAPALYPANVAREEKTEVSWAGRGRER